MVVKKIFLCTLLFSTLIFFISCGGDDIKSPKAFTITPSVSNTTIGEDSQAITITFTSDNVNDTGDNLIVNYVVSGTATSGTDYMALTESISILEEQSFATVSLLLIDDSDIEGDETIQITVSPSENILAGSELSITIQDNDEINTVCNDDNSTDQNREECDHTDTSGTSYSESLAGGVRTIRSSGIPNHDFGNQFDDLPMSNTQVTDQNHVFTMTTTPALASSSTSILSSNNRPAYEFGVAINGVSLDPAPATPFIYENSMGEYNWDWVFEPNNNMEAVGLDCAVGHVQSSGAYHYHGDMSPLAEMLSSGISTGNEPSTPVQIGWAADGFPIVYRYGPNAAGDGVELLESGYQLKSGERPGDGVDAPCGEYNGKYTGDYEYVALSGSLDECNGLSRSITLGDETFSYFYVITEEFPVIPRCLRGTPDTSFSKRP